MVESLGLGKGEEMEIRKQKASRRDSEWSALCGQMMMKQKWPWRDAGKYGGSLECQNQDLVFLFKAWKDQSRADTARHAFRMLTLATGLC